MRIAPVAPSPYLSFRPSELLTLEIDGYGAKDKTLIGGAKTEAGKNHIVTISPKIQPIIDRLAAGRAAHSRRHTFATLMKRVPGADKDEQKLIGHSSPEMLRYYQDVNVDDLRKITDII